VTAVASVPAATRDPGKFAHSIPVIGLQKMPMRFIHVHEFFMFVLEEARLE
jgi:hypothetical protein